MKILNKKLFSFIKCYNIYAELDDDVEVEATLMSSDANNMDMADFELTNIECKRDLTDEEIEKLEEMAIDFED